MTIKGIYIARHGYRSNWLPPPHPPNPTGIDSDPPLAPHGVNQAKQLAAYLVSLPEKDRPQFILTSPFYRCVETAEPIAKMLDIKIGIDRGIGEWFKKNRKIIPKPADYSDLNKFFHDVMLDEQEWPRDHLGVTPNSEGETTEEILERARKFWSVFVTQFEKKYPEIKNILLVTHAATMIALGSALLQLNTVTTAIDENQTMLRAGACSLTKYIRDEEARGGEGEEGGAARQWNIVMNGNCEFLTNGEEMNWDFTTGVEAGSTEDIARRKKEAEEKAKLNEYRLHNNLERENTPVADTVAGVSNEDEFENFFITIDLPNLAHKRDEHEEHMGSATSSSNKTKKERPRYKNNIVKSSAQLQFTNLSQETPLIKISNNSIYSMDPKSTNVGSSSHNAPNNHIVDASDVIDGRIYETRWQEYVGSELIFDDYGELVGKVKEHLTCKENVKFVPTKSQDKDKENAGGDHGRANGESSFLKKAIKLATDLEKIR